MKSTDFIVARHDLQDCKFIETQLPEAAALPDEALLIKIDRFAFTANNITYATLGDQLKYWQLFPAPANFGNIPVWGFGEVIASRHPGVEIGERLFGYFPMATHLVIEAASVSKRGLRDAAAHRQGVAPVYNAYARVSGDPAFAGRDGDYQALLRPLFMLSFLVDDFLSENDFYGARRVMLSSASSKTAFGLAHLLHTMRKGIRVIGLTSAPNVDFVQSLGCYDEVVTYDRVTSLPSDSPVAFVDMAGNSELRARLHRHFGAQTKYSGRIGLTHRRSSPDEPELPGAKPTWFFAPDQIRKRAREWGPGGIDARFGAARSDFAPTLSRRLTVVEGRGPDAVKQVYLDTLNGRIPPEQGQPATSLRSIWCAGCSARRSPSASARSGDSARGGNCATCIPAPASPASGSSPAASRSAASIRNIWRCRSRRSRQGYCRGVHAVHFTGPHDPGFPGR